MIVIERERGEMRKERTKICACITHSVSTLQYYYYNSSILLFRMYYNFNGINGDINSIELNTVCGCQTTIGVYAHNKPPHFRSNKTI